jgi:adenosylcobinamide-GDP ribazoletransferase
MSGAAENGADPPPARSISASWLDQIRLAASFLTIIPVLSERVHAPEEVAASFGWFPLVGFAMGAVLALIDYLLSGILAPAARAAMVVILLAVVTGGVHLDGLADTADALGAGRDSARALEIMRDSRIGTFGAIALFFVLILKVGALAGAINTRRYAAIILAPGLARWAMVMVADRMTYLRREGAGAAILRPQGDHRNLLIASMIAVIGVAIAHSLAVLLAAVATIALALSLGEFYRRWLGGVTGDLIGAAGEIVETAVMLAIAGSS